MTQARSTAGCLVVFVAMLGGTVALAAEGDDPICLAETQRLCPLVPVGLVQPCLQAHVSELSAECRKRVGGINDEIDRLDRDCRSDTERLCSEPQTAAGQRVACLAKHRDALSPACQKTLDAASTQ